MDRSVRKKLLISILLVSTISTTFFTAVSFYFDYKSEMSSLNTLLSELEKSSLKVIRDILINFDEEQAKNQVDGMVAIPEIVEAKIVRENSEIFYQSKSGNNINDKSNSFLGNKFLEYVPDSLITNQIPLEYEGDNIGYFEYTSTKKYMYIRLTNKLIYFFFSQALKTFLVSFIILYICQSLVTCHLENISNFLEKFYKKSMDKITNTLSLKRHQLDRKTDEFTILTKIINEMVNSIVQYNKSQQTEIDIVKNELDIHKMKAINSAKLASLGEMAGGIAHEINNPLTIIDGNISIIKKHLAKGGSVKEVEERINKVSQMVSRISAIVNGLKTFSRDGSSDPFEIKNFKKIVDDALSLCKEKFKSNGVSLELELPEEDCSIYCRSIQVSQILINIINNAYDALEGVENPKIKINVKNYQSNITISIKNNGPKIPDEIQEKILTPFFTTKEIGAGTGLGLSISLGIVKDHHGSLKLSSNDSYTEFLISLPKHQIRKSA